MRAIVVAGLLGTGCIFSPPPAMNGGADAPPSPDGGGDAAPDTPMSSRAGTPIAVWKFDEPGGATLSDGVPGAPIDLTIDPAAVVTRVAGGLSVDARSRIQSAPQPHVNVDVKTASAVTFEMWVTSADPEQGDGSYTIVGGITLSSMIKNISIEQRGTAWAARVNTSATTAVSDPPILSATVVDTKPTHLVVVADATQRTLYVNGVPSMSMPVANGDLTTWNSDQRVRIADETTGDRHWLGTFWYMAIYNTALTQADVMMNFNLGFDCTDC